MNKYRTRLQIIADILLVTRHGSKKTRIMYQANLSYRLLSRYLEEVVKAGLVSFEKGDSYMLTSRGEEFLQRFDEYHKQHNQLEEQIVSLHGEKAELERMLDNAAIDVSDSNSQLDTRRLKEKKV